jgi:hypothetical protein
MYINNDLGNAKSYTSTTGYPGPWKKNDSLKKIKFIFSYKDKV